ncbi:MAG: arginine--tRNA ligase, partial [Candidatus Hydrogenedentota bacterium]
MEKLIESKIRERLAAAIERAIEDGGLALESVPDIFLEIPNNPAHGDYATSLSLRLAKGLR